MELGTGLAALELGAASNFQFFSLFIICLNINFNIFRWSNIMGKMRMLSVGASV